MCSEDTTLAAMNDGWFVFSTANQHGDTAADARLFAAARELLAELTKARAYIKQNLDSFVETAVNQQTGLIEDPQDRLFAESDQDLLNGIDAAIAKATGSAA